MSLSARRRTRVTGVMPTILAMSDMVFSETSERSLMRALSARFLALFVASTSSCCPLLAVVAFFFFVATTLVSPSLLAKVSRRIETVFAFFSDSTLPLRNVYIVLATRPLSSATLHIGICFASATSEMRSTTLRVFSSRISKIRSVETAIPFFFANVGSKFSICFSKSSTTLSPAFSKPFFMRQYVLYLIPNISTMVLRDILYSCAMASTHFTRSRTFLSLVWVTSFSLPAFSVGTISFCLCSKREITGAAGLTILTFSGAQS